MFGGERGVFLWYLQGIQGLLQAICGGALLHFH